MKKDIEWLKEELNYFIKFETLDEREIGFELAIREVIDLLNQFDEPEVLSQEDNINIVLDDLKEHIKEQQSLSQNVGMAHTPAGNDTHYRQYDFVLECIGEYEPSDDLQNLLMPKQEKTRMTKQEMINECGMSESDWNELIGRYKWHLEQEGYVAIEKPAIPQFVAAWIEGNKQFEEKWNDYSKEDAMNDTIHFTIYGLFADYPATNSHVELRKPVLKWLSVDRGNYFKLVNAVRYGYEVEEEQKYFAKIKGHENISSDDKYWNYCITDESLDIGDNKVHADVLAEYVLSATKDEWENLGINDDNADFVEVEEL